MKRKRVLGIIRILENMELVLNSRIFLAKQDIDFIDRESNKVSSLISHEEYLEAHIKNPSALLELQYKIKVLTSIKRSEKIYLKKKLARERAKLIARRELFQRSAQSEASR